MICLVRIVSSPHLEESTAKVCEILDLFRGEHFKIQPFRNTLKCSTKSRLVLRIFRFCLLNLIFKQSQVIRCHFHVFELK
jgi:hypothetical protein